MRACSIVERALRRDHGGLVFFAGDSSLDNKYWFGDSAPAVNGYEAVLTPPTMRQDVAYHANKIFADRAPRWAAVNGAIEATSLNDRAFGRLLDMAPEERLKLVNAVLGTIHLMGGTVSSTLLMPEQEQRDDG